MPHGSYLFDIVALLLAAVVVVPFLQRLNIPSVLGYLAAGVMLGPYTPGLIVDVEATRPLAEFGVVFLLFAIGLELPLARLRLMRRFIFGLGLLQVAFTGALFGGLAILIGLPLHTSLLVGTTLAFSSTATVLALLVERNEAVTHHGRIAVSILIFQDLAVVPVLALLPLLAGDSWQMPTLLGLAAVKAGLAMAAIYVLGRFVVRPVYRYISIVRNPDVFTAANLLLVLTVAWLTAEAGMSMALGALFAGHLLADSSYRHQVEADIEPFRGLLLGLFFMTVGMSIDVPFVVSKGTVIVALTLACLAIKALVIAALSWGLGLGLKTGIRIGLLLAQLGEFGFVIFGKAVELQVIDQAIGQMLLASIALSMILTPALGAFGRYLGLRHQRQMGTDLSPSETDHLQQHVVIAGYGRVGQAIARILADHAIPYVALDLDPEGVAKAREMGMPVYYGDATQVGILRSVRIDQAKAAVVTVNRPRSAEKAVIAIRSLVPALTIVARAHDLSQERILNGAGASAVVPETMEASFQMAGLVLRSAGVPGDAADRSVQEYRRNHYAASEKADPESFKT